jgi:hypothetical protein
VAASTTFEGFGEDGAVHHVLFATITMHNDLKTFGLSLHTHMGVNQSGMHGCILSAGFGVWACHVMSTRLFRGACFV